MSAWIFGLALAAGYLINKNMTLQSVLDKAESDFQGAAKPATGGVTTAEVRNAWKSTDYATYGDFNSDWSKQDVMGVVQAEMRQKGVAQNFEDGGALPTIQGVLLTPFQ